MRSSIVLTWVCVCATLGCNSNRGESARESSEVESAPAGPPVGAWVVIDERRGLFKTSHADAGRIPSSATGETAKRFRVAEVVSIVGEFIEVRTIAAEPEGVCASSLGVERNYELRLFVQAEALQPVLARPTRVEFDDGTKLELAPGVPVIATGERGEVRVGDANLFVALTDADVGRWFMPPASEPSEHPPEGEWTFGPALHYGEHRFGSATAPFLFAQERREVEGGELLTFVSTCGRFTLRTKLDDPKTKGMVGPEDAIPAIARHFDPDTAGRVQEDCSPITWTANTRTKLSWLGGGEAGTVLAEHQLPRAAQERADRVCFEVADLDVCIETAKLERDDNPDCPDPMDPSGWSSSGNGKRVPQVRQAKAEVSEGLDSDIVRRIVRAHINEVRACYNIGLAKQPTLAGRVEIAFVILDTGKVGSSSVHATSLEPAEDRVPACMAKAVKRWTFPKPLDGATVRVVYPFVLAPG